MNELLKSAALGLLLSVVTFSFASTYSGGNGRVDNPYKISTPEDMVVLSAEEGDWGASFILINDVDMEGIDFNPISRDLQNSFSGFMDGCGFAIKNLRINGEKGRYVGLFGALSKTAQIQNIRLVDIDIDVFVPEYVEKDNYIYVGGFAGNSDGKLSNCSVSGKISAVSREITAAGGLAGRVYKTTINHCESSVSLRAVSEKQTFAGGFIGYSYTVAMMNNISNSYVYAAGSDKTYAGGLTGYALHTKFGSSCCDSGRVLIDTGGFCGGITGYNSYSEIANCYAVNDVFSFSKGFAGGLVGGNYSSIIKNSYFSGRLSQKSMKSKSGAIAGYNKASQIINCYWNYDASLVSIPIAKGEFFGKVTMLTQRQIKAGGIFNDPQWNADSPPQGPMLWEIHADKLPTLSLSAEVKEES